MSTQNDRLLELIGKGDTLQALGLLYGDGDGQDVRLATNRALYGPGGDARSERISETNQQHRAALSATQGEDRVTTLYNLGCFALVQDDVDEARMRFSEVLELNPGHTMARHNLAYAHELLAETDDARREYEAVLQQHPGALLTRLNKAQLVLQEGDTDGGLGELEAMHGADPANMGVLLYLCRALLQRGGAADLARVLELLDDNAATDRYVDLRECRAYALFLLGDLERAEAAFRSLLDASDENLFALLGLIKVIAQSGNIDGIKPHLERLHELAPSEASGALLGELARA